MIKTETIIEKVKIQYRYCDKCSKDISRNTGRNAGKCVICKDDLCFDCVGNEDSNCGDYPDRYCKPCWLNGDQFRQQIKFHEDEIDRLNNEWNNLCKK